MHFENPQTKRRLRNLLEVSGLLDELQPLPTRLATDEELLRIHTPSYVARLREMSEIGYSEAGEFTPFGKGSFEIAQRGAGACIAPADSVYDRVVRNAYVLCRPPGHHAEPDRGRGNCLFANGAITVEHLRTVRGLKRVAIVDWDVHHGNGAQSIFYHDPMSLPFRFIRTACTRWNRVGSLRPARVSLIGQTMEIQSWYHAQLQRLWIGRSQVRGERPASAPARFQLSAQKSAESAQPIGRAAAKDDRSIDTARDGNVSPRTGFHEVESKSVVRPHGEGFVALPPLAVNLWGYFGSGDDDDCARAEERQRLPHCRQAG